jgi:colanic acid/amylovoran biosynthesis glycosyltransferase
MSAKLLFVFTKHFPFGKAEQYLVDELPYLAESFDKVVFVPAENFDSKNLVQRPLPVNCEVLLLNEEGAKIKSPKKLGEFFSVFMGEWWRCRNKSWFWKERKRYKSVLLHQAHLASVMSGILKERYSNYTPTFYAYWIHNSSIMLGLMKRRGEINGFVCRGHSIDLYEWDWVLTRYIKILPFYNFIIRQAQHVFAISKHGSDYLKNRFPSLSEKFSFSRLGVSDLGINPFHADVKFSIVSCSNFTDNKGISRIAEVISNLKIPVRWIHFGDGQGKEKVEKQIKNFSPNISAELRGFVPNEEIREFYRTETVHLVINLSEAEGIPVSLMEAISFGIPVLATAVYGNPEVANENTGFNVPFDSENSKITSIIADFAGNIELQQQKRDSARNFFLSSFSASSNYRAFAGELRKLQ